MGYFTSRPRENRATHVKKVLAAPALLLVLASCGRPAAPPAPIRVTVHSDPLSLDPHLQNEVLTFGILANVYDGLTALDADLKVRPALVTSWENPDDRTWRFHLRPEKRFSDGRPVRAEDVAFSIDRALKHPRSQLVSYLVEVESVRAIDPGTVEITTKRPFAALLNKLAFVYIVPKDSPLEITAPIGSGPYRVAAYQKGRLLRLEPVPQPQGQEPPGPQIEFLPSSKSSERLALLLSGAADIVQDLSPVDVTRVKESACCTAVSRPSTVVIYLHCLANEPLFRDRRVRQAVHLALDRGRLVAASVRGYGQPASQMVGPGVFGYDPGLSVARRDLPEARRLLAEAGYPNGFEVTLEMREGRNAEELARQLAEVGIKVRIVTRPWTEMYARLSRREVPFYYGGLASVTADASDIFDSAVHSVEHGYGATNQAGTSNARLDRLIEESGATMQPEARRTLLQSCMRLVMEDLYLLPLYVQHDIYAQAKSVVWEPRLDRMLLGREMRRAAR